MRAVDLKDGRELPADLVVMAVGIRPNTALAQAMQASIADAAIRSMTRCAPATERSTRSANASSIAGRYSAWSRRCGTWRRSAPTASRTRRTPTTIPAVTGTRLKVTGIDMFSAGDFLGDETTEEIVFRDAARGVHKRLVLRGEKLIGAVLYGEARDGAWYFDLIRQRARISRRCAMRWSSARRSRALPRNPAWRRCRTAPKFAAATASRKGRILAAIAEHKLTTLDEVRARTKASASCGSCTCQVEALLAQAAGAEYDAAPKVKAMCKCTRAWARRGPRGDSGARV